MNGVGDEETDGGFEDEPQKACLCLAEGGECPLRELCNRDDPPCREEDEVEGGECVEGTQYRRLHWGCGRARLNHIYT